MRPSCYAFCEAPLQVSTCSCRACLLKSSPQVSCPAIKTGRSIPALPQQRIPTQNPHLCIDHASAWSGPTLLFLSLGSAMPAHRLWDPVDGVSPRYHMKGVWPSTQFCLRAMASCVSRCSLFECHRPHTVNMTVTLSFHRPSSGRSITHEGMIGTNRLHPWYLTSPPLLVQLHGS